MSHKTRFLSLLMLLLLGSVCRGQELEYNVKAEYIERFTRFIDWPADSHVSEPGGSFRICTFGANPFGNYLKNMADEVRIKGKSVEVKEIAATEEIGSCDVLFIPRSESEQLQAILKATSDRPVLTIGDTPGYAEKGVLINFFQSESRILFEINPEAAKKGGLRFSSRLLGLARQVKGGEN